MSENERRMTESGTERTRRRFIGVAGVVAGTTLIAGCGGDGAGTVGSPNGTTDGGMETDTEMNGGSETDGETETDGEMAEAMVRVGHLSPDAPAVDVYVDGSLVLEEVGFGTVSDYLAIAAGTYTVRVTPAGDSETTVFEGEVTVESGVAYTVAAIGEVSEGGDQPFEPLILEDQNEPPASDTARVRAVHTSPDAPAVDITVGDGETVLFDGVEYGQSGYVEVPAGDYTLEIRADTESNDGDVAAEFDVSVEGGQVYTAFAAGYLTPDDEPTNTPFDLIVTQDTESTGTEGTGTEGTGTEGTGTEGTGTGTDGTAMGTETSA